MNNLKLLAAGALFIQAGLLFSFSMLYSFIFMLLSEYVFKLVKR